MTEYLVVKEESPSGIGDQVLLKTAAKAELLQKLSLFNRIGYKIRVYTRPVADWAEIKGDALADFFAEAKK